MSVVPPMTILTGVDPGPLDRSTGGMRWRLAATLGAPLSLPGGPLTSGSFSISCALSPLVRFHSLRAPLAQLAEQLTLNQRVRGSSP